MIVELCDRLRLYVVIDPSLCKLDPAVVAEGALHGGATALQLRSKTLTDRDTLNLASQFAMLCKRTRALCIVNDRLDIALACGAQGVHLGVDDLPLNSAREIAGPDFVIGYSPETDEQASLSAGAGASYLGVGPVFGTASKSDAGPAIGLELLTSRRTRSGLPTVGIGGVNAGNAAEIIATGACGVAVMSAVTLSDEPAAATRAIARAIEMAQR